MRIVFVDTYYRRFLAKFYADHPLLEKRSYEEQHQSLMGARFGTSDFYSTHLADLGCEAFDLVANCVPLQQAWLKENGLATSRLAFPIPHRFYRVPAIGSALAALPGYLSTVLAQIRALKPDIFYCHDLSLFPGWTLRMLKPHVKLIVGQIAYLLPPRNFVEGYDLILTSFPHYVQKIRAIGIASEYFRLGFDPSVAEALGGVKRDIDVSFVGAIGRSHSSALSLIEHLCRMSPIRIFGYGIEDVPQTSPIHERYEKEVWGLDMFQVLARSKITFNRHISVAGNYANNMRLYEATGMGAALLTDMKDNLRNLFELGQEVETYSGLDEAVAKVNALLRNPERRAEVASRGQARTMRDHTYQIRMHELRDILSAYLRASPRHDVLKATLRS